MKTIIDTQILIWAAENNPKLRPSARAVLNDPGREIFVSLASFWEISIKMNIGKLAINGLSFQAFFEEVEKSNYRFLEIGKSHLFVNASLVWHHRDPFDRLLVSQAIAEKMDILSSDQIFDLYPVSRVW